MSDYFPPEVLTEILARLPTKSIVQCTSVSKSWYNLITSPTFISAHLNRNHDDYLLVRHCYVDPKKEDSFSDYIPSKEIYALYCDNDNFDQYTLFDEPPFKPPYQYFSHFNIVGSCNGLLCLSDDLTRYTDLFYLWNPSIQKSLKLPKPIFVYDTYGPFDHTLGFGFDSVDNDFKVVRIVHTGFCTDKVPPHVELYKLSTGVWKDITHVAPSYKFFERKPGVYVNGSCHWVARKKGKKGGIQNMIVLFDVHEESFWDMMLPGILVQRFWMFSEDFVLFVSDESLCLADYDKTTSFWEAMYPEESSHGNDKRIDIWMMKEYGDPESWVKRFSIRLQNITFSTCVVDDFWPLSHPRRERKIVHSLRKPIASRRNGDILWRADSGLLVSYDPVTEKIKNLGIRNANCLPYNDALHVITYKESLILLGKQAYCAESSCEESSSFSKRGPKGGKKFFEGKTRKRMGRKFTKKRTADCTSVADQ